MYVSGDGIGLGQRKSMIMMRLWNLELLGTMRRRKKFTLVFLIPIAMVLAGSVYLCTIYPPLTGNLLFGEARGRRLESQISKLDCLEKIHSRRASNLRSVCSAENNTAEPYLHKGPYEFFLQKQYNFTYCKIQKTGSTFWMLLFQTLGMNVTLDENDGQKSRFQLHEISEKYKTGITEIQKNPRKSIITARNPFSRLFSAYVDRIYLPFDWGSAKMAARARLCPGNVTFQQFLDYIVTSVNTKRMMDFHWVPMTVRCIPCVIKPEIIVKTETFSDDMTYVLHKYGIDLSGHEYLSDLLYGHTGDSALPAIIEELDGRLSHGENPEQNEILKCLSVIEVAQKAWTAFQIQGYISDEAPFPVERLDKTAKSLGALQLMRHIEEALHRYPLSKDASKAQRKNAMLKAYQAIKPQTLDVIKYVYKNDFLVFNYDFDPSLSSSIVDADPTLCF